MIRLLNGAVALFVPGALLDRLGAKPETNSSAQYALRLFGVRTILIGAELLRGDDAVRAHAVRIAPIIHASDATAAIIAGVVHQVPARGATMAAVISIVNTILAIVAQPRKGSDLKVKHSDDPPRPNAAHE